MSDFLSFPVVTKFEMKLSTLFQGIQKISPREDREIRSLAYDSRQVQKGGLFVAIPGNLQDGQRFVPEAVSKGAEAFVVQKKIPSLAGWQMETEDPRRLLADLAARFYGEPSLSLRLIGVTGTNGKTTLTYLMESILREAGRKPGVIGTVNYRYHSVVKPAPTTTPESLDLQELLREMRQQGVTDVVMEVSSHALDQGRVRGIHFDAAAFTNLSRDHLDYHRTLENYLAAKRRLFDDYLPASRKPEKFAVLKMRDPKVAGLAGQLSVREIRVGSQESDEVGVVRQDLSEQGIQATIRVAGKKIEIHSPLIGSFNLENLLVAVGLAYGIGIPFDKIASGLKKAQPVPGRLESIPNRAGIQAFVDYAHTPEALAGVGQALRPLCRGRLITVFGCGGDRDRGKRPEMGQEAGRFSDWVIVTSDNPRRENPETIIDEILPGLKISPIDPSHVLKISDRRQAIEKAVKLAEPGDLILVAGKGHEDYQILGDKKIHFSDQEVLRELLGS